MLSNVGSFEVAVRIFDEQLLQGQGRLEADAQMAVIAFQDGERLCACFERGMSPGLNFVSFGYSQTDLAQFRQDLLCYLFAFRRLRHRLPVPFRRD